MYSCLNSNKLAMIKHCMIICPPIRPTALKIIYPSSTSKNPQTVRERYNWPIGPGLRPKKLSASLMVLSAPVRVPS